MARNTSTYPALQTMPFPHSHIHTQCHVRRDLTSHASQVDSCSTQGRLTEPVTETLGGWNRVLSKETKSLSALTWGWPGTHRDPSLRGAKTQVLHRLIPV